MPSCPNCGAENPDDRERCEACGYAFRDVNDGREGDGASDVDAPFPSETPNGEAGPTRLPPTPAVTNSSPFAGQNASQTGLYALVAGIVGLLLLVTCLYLSPFAGVLAIVLGIRGRRDPNANHAMAVAGLIMGILALVASVIVIIFLILALTGVWPNLSLM